MSKRLLVIPVIIGIAVAVFAAAYFGGNQKSSDFTMADFTSRGSPYEGNSAAPITIVEFGDYQCTYCYKFHGSSLDVIKSEYLDTGKANLIFVDFPLNGPDSVLAAEASHCADDQGKFWAYHNELYQNWAGERTGWVNRDSLNKFAGTVGLDITQFNECLDSKKYNSQVNGSYDFGQKIGIGATPSFLVISGSDVIKITGNQPIEVFRKTLDGI